MRVALLSDIHGNLVALDAVLERLESERIDLYVCLGDVASFGPQPREVLDRLRLLGAENVLGNTDAWLLDPKPHAIRDADTPRVNHIELWCAERLTEEDREYLRTFRPLVALELDDDALLLCYHGSPRSNRDTLRPTTPDEEIEAMMAGHRADVLAGGHTHNQMLRRYREIMIVNPGSVGQAAERARDTGQVHWRPYAEYAILDCSDGCMGVELGRVPFDADAVIEAARDGGMPHVDWWAGFWRHG